MKLGRWKRGGPPRRCLVDIISTVTIISVLSGNYFQLFSFVHCDRDHHHQWQPVNSTLVVSSNHPTLELSGTSIPSPSHSNGARAPSRGSGPVAIDGEKIIASDNHQNEQQRRADKPGRHGSVELISERGARDDARPLVGGVATLVDANQRQGAPPITSHAPSLARPRTKRMARSKTSRVQLAQRPPKSTTTTTTSTTTTTAATTTAAENGTDAPVERLAQEEDEERESDSGDYEDIRQTATTAKPGAKTTASESDDQESELAGEGESEQEADENDETTTTTTTTTTSTTTTTRRPKAAKSGKKASRAKIATKSEEGKKVAKVGDKRESSEDSPPKGADEKKPSESNSTTLHQHHRIKKKPLVALPFIRPKNTSVCVPEAYLEFPRDPIGDKWRGRGLVIIHVLIVCYMFYSLALVCERYFMPSLEEFAQRLQISEDVAGATLMSAGSSAPELFTAILGVFVAKGDVGTGAIVGSAVFNILFVIGVCAFVSSTSAQLQWWPVLRDSIYYTFTVLVLIVIIYDERITAIESGIMILLYGLYITIMVYNEQLRAYVTSCLLNNPVTAKLISTSSIQIDGPDDVFGGGSTSSASRNQYEMNATIKTVEDDSIFMAALLIIIKHKRLFRSTIRFQSAARYIIIKRQHRRQQQQRSTAQEVNYFGPEETTGEGQSMMKRPGSGSGNQRAKMEAFARSTTLSKQKFSIVSKDDYEFWHRPPEEGENHLLWLARIPVNYLLHYTIPDCTLYPDKYVITFFTSIIWTAVFSYLMVWMVTLIGYTLGIPDSVMGVTFLAAGTSVPDCYSSIHAARNGMADMAVSNSIGSNVFDILIGLSVPWFIQSAIYPGVVATINSRGVIYSVVLLFLSLVVTIYLMNKYEWSLQPRLGLALLIAYGLFIILTCMLEFNLFGHVNPPACPPPIASNGAT